MKMLLKRNLLENILIISNCGTFTCLIIYYLTDISLLAGKWFLLYILALFIVSVFFSFRVIQWLLSLNKPLCYDFEGFVKKYPFLAPLRDVLPELPKRKTKHEWREYDTNELSVISTVLERKLVSSWYVQYISQEIGFPFACKQMLDQMIGKTFQVCSNIETKDVFVDICTILILHLKEYEKAVKRHEKSPNDTIQSLYKTSHATSDADQIYTSVDHCTNILRIMIKELLPWELRDTPHSELLVRILSKKLDSYIDSTLADPAWLNDKLMTYLTGYEYIDFKKEELIKDIEVLKETVQKDVDISTENVVTQNNVVLKEVEQESQGETEGVTEEEEDSISIPELKDVKSSPVLRQKRGRQGRNEVKIYDRIIEGSVKTWETDMDLQCISLGQDLLASLDGEVTLSRMWGHEGHEGSPEAATKSPQLCAGEEDALELDPPCPSPRLHSPKATDILKDFQSTVSQVQSTVSQAKHKIGDLQVKELDVSNGASDEAAGMMEGLLDLGIAGLKKGLRFTGLSDDSQEKSPVQGREKSDKSPPSGSDQRPELSEPGLAAPILKEDNGSSTPHLVKQHHVSSQDSVSLPVAIPASAESPEPQYEEAADLSTSIAKLRCLLNQSAEAGPQQQGTEEVRGEVRGEARGEVRGQAPPTPVDCAAFADEYDTSLERNSANQTSNNNMQRLDKLFHRTVTGVFNSLKTAVGAEEPGAPAAHAQRWAYVLTSNELSVCVVAARLAWARRARGVEAALDPLEAALDPLQAALDPLEAALDPLQAPRAPAPPPPPGAAPEDLEEWLSTRARAWCAGSEAARALPAHVAQRLASLLLADVAESLITCWLEGLASWLRERIFLVFERMDEGAAVIAETKRPFNEDHTCAVIVEKMPVLKVIFGEEAVSTSIHSAVSSLSRAAVNKDVAYRIVDLLALHFKVAAGVRNPSFDNN